MNVFMDALLYKVVRLCCTSLERERLCATQGYVTRLARNNILFHIFATMDIINNAIGEYQQMIGIHDKQPWERSVERAVNQSLHNLTRKRAKVNKDLIDVDLVRGSTFSKIKPRHSWLTVSWKALIRVLFLPFYCKWWMNCCGRTGYTLLVLLFISQAFSIYIYLTDDLTPGDEALSLSHLLTPSIMLLILAIVHTQIMSSTFDQQPPHPSSSSSSCQSNQFPKEKHRIANSRTDFSENPLTNHEMQQDVYMSNRRPMETQSCKCCNDLRASDDEDSREKLLSASTENHNSESSFHNGMREEKKCIRKIDRGDLRRTAESDEVQVSSSSRGGRKTSEGSKSPSPSVCISKECLCQNRNADSKHIHSKGDVLDADEEEDEDSCGLSSLLLQSPNSDLRGSSGQRLNKNDGHDTNSTTSSLNSEEDDDDDEEDDDVAVEDIVVVHEGIEDRDNMSVARDGRVASPLNCNRCSAGNKNSNKEADSIGNLQNNNSDPSEGCVVRKRHVFTQNLCPSKSCRALEGSTSNHQPSDKSSPESKTTSASQELTENKEKMSSEGHFGRIEELSGKCVGRKTSSNHRGDDGCPEDDESIYLEARDSSATHRSSEFERRTQQPEENQMSVCRQTSLEVSELVKSYSRKSISTTGNKVSCIIWEGGDLQKVDLTVLDIGWNIIKKVEKSCLSYDYLLLGVTFSLLLALTPIIFRVYHNWSHLEGIKIFDNSTDLNRAMSVAVGHNWRQVTVICNGIVQRLFLSCLLFFMLAVSERTFYQRLLYAKNFCYLTSLRRARKYQLPHFRLNKVRNIKTWLSIRSFLKRRGPQRSVEIIVSTAFLAAVVIVSIICIELLQDYGSFLDELGNWELVMWGLSIGVFLLRFITLGTNINKKYRNFSVLITEQINLYLHMEQKPHKKNELMMANSVLKLAEDLLKEVESPFKVSGLSANPLLYNITKVVVLSAFSAVLTELLGFKLKLHKIKIRS